MSTPNTMTGSVQPGDAIVYVVDDDEAVRDSLRWLLEAQGFQVRAFAAAEHFLAALRDERGPAPMSCALVDVRMPGMSGLELQDELLRRWRQGGELVSSDALPPVLVWGGS